MKKTGWYPSLVKPIHIGFYERGAGFMTIIDYWNGSVWGLDGERCWRGLENKP